MRFHGHRYDVPRTREVLGWASLAATGLILHGDPADLVRIVAKVASASYHWCQ